WPSGSAAESGPRAQVVQRVGAVGADRVVQDVRQARRGDRREAASASVDLVAGDLALAVPGRPAGGAGRGAAGDGLELAAALVDAVVLARVHLAEVHQRGP